MNNEQIRLLLDACFMAKKITETMPALPKGIKPRHIHVITYVAEQSTGGDAVRVSDVSVGLKVTLPSITKLVHELEEQKLVTKSACSGDKRAIALTLTTKGMEYYQVYVIQYHNRLLQELEQMREDECVTAIATIKQLYHAVATVAKEESHAD